MPDRDYYMELPYHIKWDVDWSDWREQHVAYLTGYIEEIPAVRATADNASKAVILLRANFSSWIEGAIAEGVEIPPPTYP